MAYYKEEHMALRLKTTNKLFIQYQHSSAWTSQVRVAITIYACKGKDKWKLAYCLLNVKIMCVQRCHHAPHEIKAWDVSIIWHKLLYAKIYKSRKWGLLPYRSGINEQANISWYQVGHTELVHVHCFRECQRHCDSLSSTNTWSWST